PAGYSEASRLRAHPGPGDHARRARDRPVPRRGMAHGLDGARGRDRSVPGRTRRRGVGPRVAFPEDRRRDRSVSARPIPHLRWSVAALLCLASELNYLDRQTLSVLAATIQKDLGLSDVDYSHVTSAFLMSYTVMYAVAGW